LPTPPPPRDAAGDGDGDGAQLEAPLLPATDIFAPEASRGGGGVASDERAGARLIIN
jgi:hypothetical protein